MDDEHCSTYNIGKKHLEWCILELKVKSNSDNRIIITTRERRATDQTMKAL